MTNRKSAIVVALILAMTSSAIAAGPRDGLWKEVNEAVKKGLPKTAVEKLKPIIEGATRDKAYAEAIRNILSNDDLREKMGAAGKRRYEERYTHKQFINSIVQVFTDLREA